MLKVEIYTTPMCPYCHAAKAMLDKKGADYDEITVVDPKLRLKMTDRANGRRTVPQIFIGGNHVGGYDEMAALERGGKLDDMLKAS